MVSAKRQGERSCIPLLPERKKRGKLVHARRTEVYGWWTMERKQYFLVDADALPEVFTHVVTAKRLLADGKAASTSEAARMAGISRGAFYKYRDAVFPYTSVVERSILTVQAMLADQQMCIRDRGLPLHRFMPAFLRPCRKRQRQPCFLTATAIMRFL